MGDLFPAAVDEIVAATSARGGVTGVPSGLAVLDRVTGGWQDGDLIVIAARPGMGKTSVSLAMANMAEEAANLPEPLGKAGPGFFASLEMSAGQLVKKVIATELSYTTSQLTKGANLSRDEAARLAAVLPNPRQFSISTPSAYVQRRTRQISRQMRALGGQRYIRTL